MNERPLLRGLVIALFSASCAPRPMEIPTQTPTPIVATRHPESTATTLPLRATLTLAPAITPTIRAATPAETPRPISPPTRTPELTQPKPANDPENQRKIETAKINTFIDLDDVLVDQIAKVQWIGENGREEAYITRLAIGQKHVIVLAADCVFKAFEEAGTLGSNLGPGRWAPRNERLTNLHAKVRESEAIGSPWIILDAISLKYKNIDYPCEVRRIPDEVKDFFAQSIKRIPWDDIQRGFGRLEREFEDLIRRFRRTPTPTPSRVI